jgi:hypothetical protein
MDSLSRRQGELPDLAGLIAAVDRVTKAFEAQQGVPSESTTLEALRACAQNDFKLMSDFDKHHELGGIRESPGENTATHLLELDRKGSTGVSAVRIQDVADKMSDAVYRIITNPAVFITPQLLEEYVKIQARLGKPETLPQVFSLYASKPIAEVASGSIKYSKQNPDKASNAVDAKVGGIALDAAIETRNLDAAIAIVENVYATKAFIRSKLIRQALLPATALGAVPIATYAGASALSTLQNTIDQGTATAVAFVGIMAYVGFTSAIGLVAVSTANDQMQRVTWAPGTPLRERWLREDERAALDKVAVSFGFSEPYRYGEEEGAEFKALKEYLLRKGMVLDAVELMEGMG